MLEGETIVFLAGLAAQHGYLWFPAVVALAVTGGFLADQFFFFIGRRYGDRVIARGPSVASRAPRIQAQVRRWDVLAIVAVRFLYGLRTAAPVVIGTCGIALWRVIVYDFIGALLWGALVAGAGYFAGQALQEWFGRIDPDAGLFLIGIALVMATAWNVIRAPRRPKPTNGRPAARERPSATP